MQGQDQAMDLKGDLVGVGLLAELALGLSQFDSAAQSGLPSGHRRSQGIAHRAAAVIELDRATDVDAARIDLAEVCTIQLSNKACRRAGHGFFAWPHKKRWIRSGRGIRG